MDNLIAYVKTLVASQASIEAAKAMLPNEADGDEITSEQQAEIVRLNIILEALKRMTLPIKREEL